AEMADGGINQGGAEFFEVAESLGNTASQNTVGLAAACRTHGFPVKFVVPALGGVIEKALQVILARRLLDDPFQGGASKASIRRQHICFVHIGAVVLFVTKFQRISADKG